MMAGDYGTLQVYYGLTKDTSAQETEAVPAIIEAIYEHGVFKPLQTPDIPAGQHVRLVIEPVLATAPEDMLTLAAQVYEGLAPEQVDAIEKIALHRRDFFGEMTL